MAKARSAKSKTGTKRAVRDLAASKGKSGNVRGGSTNYGIGALIAVTKRQSDMTANQD